MLVNNQRAKTILIVFFMLTNMCLLTMLLHSYNTYRRVPDDVIKTASELLNERGIIIDKELIPTSISIQKQVLVENIITSYDDFAKTILGENIQKKDNIFFSGIGEVSFDGDKFFIKYNNGYETNEKKKSPSDKAEFYLNSIGINTKNSDIYSSNNDQGVFTVIFTKMLYGKPFFDCSIQVDIVGTKITRISGCWFNKYSTEAAQPTKPVSGLLVSYSARNIDFTNVKIISLKSGYAINENGVFHKQAVLLPVYEITTDKYNKIYIDARGN